MNAIRELFAKYRKKLIAPVAVVLAAIILLDFYFVFEVTPQPNDECLWVPQRVYKDSIGIFFQDVKFEGVTWNAGIRDGDQLISINGTRISRPPVATRILNTITEGDSATYTVARGDRIFTTLVEVKKLIQFGGLAFALLSGIWLLVGIIVITSKPDGLTQVLFFRIGATLTLFSTFNLLITQNIYNPIYDYPVLVLLFDIVWTIGGAFLPFLIVHFFWLFPKKFDILEKKYTTKILYITPLVIFVASILFRVLFIYTGIINTLVFYAVYTNVNLALIYIGSVVGLVSLFISYIRLKTKHERNAIFLILVSYAIGILAVLYTTIVQYISDQAFLYNSPEYFMPIILISLVPVAFAFSIFKYSLMDVSDVVKNGLMYGTATVTVAGLYFFIIYLLGQSLSQAISTEYQGLIAGLIFIVFAFVFQSTKDRFQTLITKRFYPEQFAYQNMIVKFSHDVATIVGLENILHSTCKTFVDALKLDRFGIAIRNKTNQKMFDAVEGTGFVEFPFSIETDISKMAEFILSKKDSNLPIVIEENDFKEIFPEDYDLLSEEGIYTIIPLIIKSRIIGFLLFGLKYSGSKFAGKDLELLTAASNQVAVAIENARLYESEKEKLILDRDLENARRIQKSLLPSKIPQIAGLDISGTMIPAMHVGGDYFDVIKVSETKVFVVIGDVSGKGLSASFYMSKLQTMIQLYCTEDKSPKQVLSEVNRKIFGTIERNWFITVSIALFDTEKKELTFCRAGHTPLLVSKNGDIKQLQPSGIGVGLENGDLFDRNLEEITIPIESNELFTMFSDGVNETMNSVDQLYGMDRFFKCISANSSKMSNEILNSALNDIEQFKKDTPQYDDITLVLVKTTKM